MLLHQIPPRPAYLRVKIGRRPQHPALRQLAEVVRDVDVKDAKYGREEAPGIAQAVSGIAAAHAADEDRLARGSALFDDLYAGHRASPRQKEPT